jgi:nucleoside-diphosphate-sugar epimerase
MNFTGRFSDQTILVTGGSGFLGQHLCARLQTSGADVHAVVRQPPLDRRSGTQWWQGDMGDIETVRQLYATVKPSIIFHLTTYGTGAPDLKFVYPTLHSDFLATVNVLTMATERGCSRVVIAASLEEPQPESDDLIPSSPYAAAKWASSTYARMFYRLYGTPVIMVRPFMTYGPGQRTHKLIPYVILELLQGRVPKLSSGCRPIDWIYVDDVIEGMLAAAYKEDIVGCTIDLGSGTLISINDMVNQLVRVVGTTITPCFGALPDRPFEKVRVADIEDAYKKLGWKPETPLQRGLAQTVQWYREQLQYVSSHDVLEG